MSRRLLAVVVGILGFAIAGVTFVGLMMAGSLFADARTAQMTGAGVDIFLRTPFPGETDPIVIDVEARGGSRAGIHTVRVSRPEGVITEATGHGVSWGSTINEGKSRGSETVTVQFPMPESVVAGQTLRLDLAVSYVCAMSSNGSFSNESHQDTVHLDVPVYSSSGRTVARLLALVIALGCWLIWFAIVWGVTALYARAEGDASETEGIGLLMGILGGGVTGYWVFAWRIMKVLETQSTAIAALLTIAWLVGPLYWAYRWKKRQPKRPRVETTGVIPGSLLDARGIGYDTGEVTSTLLLEICKARMEGIAELAAVVTWADETIAAPVRDAHMRRRVLALNWVLVKVGPKLAGDKREVLLGFVRDAIALVDDEARDRLAASVIAALST